MRPFRLRMGTASPSRGIPQFPSSTGPSPRLTLVFRRLLATMLAVQVMLDDSGSRVIDRREVLPLA